ATLMPLPAPPPLRPRRLHTRMPERLDRPSRPPGVPSPTPVLRVAVVARSVYPLHGLGGLERHVYELVPHLVARGGHVTLIAKPAANGTTASAVSADDLEVPTDRLRLIAVPYVTFPGAGRRGTTVADRISAYPFFGWRAGRVAAKLAYRGEVDLVYAL